MQRITNTKPKWPSISHTFLRCSWASANMLLCCWEIRRRLVCMRIGSLAAETRREREILQIRTQHDVYLHETRRTHTDNVLHEGRRSQKATVFVCINCITARRQQMAVVDNQLGRRGARHQCNFGWCSALPFSISNSAARFALKGCCLYDILGGAGTRWSMPPTSGDYIENRRKSLWRAAVISANTGARFRGCHWAKANSMLKCVASKSII